MLGSMNPMNLMPFGSEKEEKDAGEEKDFWIVIVALAFSVNRQCATASAGITHITRWQDPEEKMQKQLSYIEKDKCHFVDTRLPKLHQMRDWQFVTDTWASDVLKVRILFLFHQNLIAFCQVHQWISMNQSAMIINGFPTCRRFATWIARWLGSWVRLLAVQLDMRQRKSWRRNPRSQAHGESMTVYVVANLLFKAYTRPIILWLFYDFLVQNGTVLVGCFCVCSAVVWCVRCFRPVRCGYAVRACSHLAYLSQWFRSTLVTWYIPHLRAPGGLPYPIEL